MASAVFTQTATYVRKRYDYILNSVAYTGYEAIPRAAKRFAQALESLGMTITHVAQDTTQEYDETQKPNAQPSQAYRAHVVDPVYKVGIYIDTDTSVDYNSYNGAYHFFRTGLTSDGAVIGSMPTAAYCFDVAELTIIKRTWGDMVKYIFPLSSSSAGSSSNAGYNSNSTVVGQYATLSGFKATNMITGEESLFGTFGVDSSGSWFVGTPYNIVNNMAHNNTGHASNIPQSVDGMTILWQSPLYCGGMLYDKINGGRLFSSGLPTGADFTVDGVTLHALNTRWAVELL